MSSLPFVAKITRDCHYPHLENAYQFTQWLPPGFNATEAPDWVTGTVRGTNPGPSHAAKTLPGNDEPKHGFRPQGAVDSLFDDLE